jgi:hypothetical protein
MHIAYHHQFPHCSSRECMPTKAGIGLGVIISYGAAEDGAFCFCSGWMDICFGVSFGTRLQTIVFSSTCANYAHPQPI